MPLVLPPPIERWLSIKGWSLHPHQRDMLEAAEAGHSALLIAPTGAGKTLSGFLPSLCDLIVQPQYGLHTLYISPLKALAVDIERNLQIPLKHMGLDPQISAETRTGDTPYAKKQRQRRRPPNLLMTTPESLALLLSYPDASEFFGSLKCLILDELHALAPTKRGDLLALGLARLDTLAPGTRRIGLSATVADEIYLRDWLSPRGDHRRAPVHIVRGTPGPAPDVQILDVPDTPKTRMPWAGHMALYAINQVMEQIAAHTTTLVFVNTRAQAELVFHELWRLNDQGFAIAMHHGSLNREQRRKVEAAMAHNQLKAVVATASLDLGIDWGQIDLVIQVGAPKGVSRLLQRIGRANHRFGEPSKAILVPASRLEVLECRACIGGVYDRDLDSDLRDQGGLDVLAQHIVGMACSAPFYPADLYAEIRHARPYRALSQEDFEDVLNFVKDGGYALKAYSAHRRLLPHKHGGLTIRDTNHAQRYRMNVGTIVEANRLRVIHKAAGYLGDVEEYFAGQLQPGDTFIFGGQRVGFRGLDKGVVKVGKPESAKKPIIPVYGGGYQPLTQSLAERVRALLQDPKQWNQFPAPVRQWLKLQGKKSALPSADELLVETFPRGERFYLVAYGFEGRNAHQTLGMLLTKRMERMGYGPLGFVASDYMICVWSIRPAEDVATLFDQDMLGDDLESWMLESSLLRVSFWKCAVIAGLVEQNFPGKEKSQRQRTISSNLIYDVLRRHEPDHILLRAARADAAYDLCDVSRVAQMLTRFQGKIDHHRLRHVSPLSVPAMLEYGRHSISGGAGDDLLAEAELHAFETDLLMEALSHDTTSVPENSAKAPRGINEGGETRSVSAIRHKTAQKIDNL